MKPEGGVISQQGLLTQIKMLQEGRDKAPLTLGLSVKRHYAPSYPHAHAEVKHRTYTSMNRSPVLGLRKTEGIRGSPLLQAAPNSLTTFPIPPAQC